MIVPPYGKVAGLIYRRVMAALGDEELSDLYKDQKAEKAAEETPETEDPIYEAVVEPLFEDLNRLRRDNREAGN